MIVTEIQTVPEKVDQASSPPEYASVWDSLRDPYYDQKQVKKFITKFSGMFRKNKVDRAKIPVTKNIWQLMESFWEAVWSVDEK